MEFANIYLTILVFVFGILGGFCLIFTLIIASDREWNVAFAFLVSFIFLASMFSASLYAQHQVATHIEQHQREPYDFSVST